MAVTWSKPSNISLIIRQYSKSNTTGTTAGITGITGIPGKFIPRVPVGCT